MESEILRNALKVFEKSCRIKEDYTVILSCIIKGLGNNMNFKHIIKKAATICFVVSLSIGSLTGCGKDTKLVFTTGLSGNELFKIGSATCTTPEIMIYLTTFYNQYADTYGQQMWHYDLGGVSLEEHVKDVVLSKMTQIKIMNLMAEERDIKLSAQEEQKIYTAAEHYYENLEKKLRDREGITKKITENVFREYALANKVYENITESADMEISDDEARTVTVQVIYLKNWKLKNNEKVLLEETEKQKVLETANEILGRIEEGEDFETLASQYSDDKQVVKHYARGVADDAFEEILFSMDQGDVSSVVETGEGFYIVKCISTMDYDATQENKVVLAEKRKREAFSQAYTEIATNTHSQFRDKQWEKITLNEEIHKTDADFFEVYDEYIKQ